MTKLRDDLTVRQREWIADGAVSVEFVPEGLHVGLYRATGRTGRMMAVGRSPRLAIEALRETSTA